MPSSGSRQASAEVIEQAELDLPALRIDRQAVLARLVEAVEHLAVDVELELAACRVAHPHGLRALVAVEPRQLELAQAPLAGDAVHDLDVGRIAGDCAHEPAPPLSRLVGVVAMEEREQGQRRVAQPAVAVVPVAHGADPLRQRRRRRGDDPAGRVVRERLEDDERPADERRPVAWQLDWARLAPLPPEPLGVGERLLGIDRLRDVLVRPEPREHEGNALTLVDPELRDRAHVLAAGVRRGAEAEGVGAGEGDAGVVLVRALAHPRDDAAVVEADRQLRSEANAALHALDDAHDVGRLPARRHEVEDTRDRTVVRLPDRLEDERVVEIAARARRRRRRREEPAAAVRAAEERGEAGPGVETREAQPVDRAAAVDERSRLQVAQECVILDARAHVSGSRSPGRVPASASGRRG